MTRKLPPPGFGTVRPIWQCECGGGRSGCGNHFHLANRQDGMEGLSRPAGRQVCRARGQSEPSGAVRHPREVCAAHHEPATLASGSALRHRVERHLVGRQGRKLRPEQHHPIPTAGFAIHAPGKVHYDGAKDEEVIVQISGTGPSGTNVVNPGDAKKK